MSYDEDDTEVLTCLQLTLQDNTTSKFQSRDAAITNTVLRSLFPNSTAPYCFGLKFASDCRSG